MLAALHPTQLLFDFEPVLAPRRPVFCPQYAPMAFTQTGLQLSRDEDKYIVTSALPGVKREDIHVELMGNRILRLYVEQAASSRAFSRPDQPKSTPSDKDPHHPDERPSADAFSSPAPEAAATAKPAPSCTINLAAQLESVVVIERSVNLPQLVDSGGITCTYRDGLLRIEIPIQAPSLDDEHRTLVARLEQDAADAGAQVAELAKQLREQKAKAEEALTALRLAQRDANRALQTRCHTLAIA